MPMSWPLERVVRRAILLACLALAVLALSPRPVLAQAAALASPGPLARAHASLEGLDKCQKCHEPGRQVTAARCLACHQPIASRIAAKRGVHRNVSGECIACHAEHNGRDAELRPFDTKSFDHATEAGFPLDGRHAPLARDCAKCHKTRSFLTASPSCSSCHVDVHKGTLGVACATCHSVTRAFADATQSFDHSKARFRLVGAHQSLACSKCHVTKNSFTGLKFAACTDCHREPHQQRLGADCTACHSNDTWKTRKVDHAKTGFPLRGRHADLQCVSCHVKSPVVVRLKADRCAVCHTDVHRGQFKQDCAACHKETGFAKAPFDHGQTPFPLTGAHAGLACAKCHKGSNPGPARTGVSPRAVLFGGASSACASCHNDAHAGSAGPQCGSCHTTTTFRITTYAHRALPPGFMTGSHAGAACAACHALGGQKLPLPSSKPAVAARATGGTSPATESTARRTWKFAGVGTACTTCHTEPHAGQFGAACERCHAVETPQYRATRFSHDASSFPLTGRHRGVECAKCHQPENGNATGAKAVTVARVSLPAGTVRYAGVGTACSSCHADVHLGQLAPQCGTCHTTEGFAVTRYDHKGTRFAGFFTGKHADQKCQACHKRETAAFPAGSGTAVRFAGRGTACATCHQAADPHNGSLGSRCETCHAPERWNTVSRAFHKDTRFPLDGRHLGVSCQSCHTSGVTAGTPTRCYDCHWLRRRDDPYETRLGVQCEQCHRSTAWTAVNWNHASMTGVRLNPAHQVLQCETCHKNRVFANTLMTCDRCHMATFQRTTTPNHVAAGFPTTCDTCHRASDATWTAGTFNHAASFPLVGVHATVSCASCHRNSLYKGTARDCAGCHQVDYQKTSSPNHAAAGFPTTCEACHRPTDASWRGANFNHASTFPLVGVHATQACAACHKNNVFKGTARDCAGCHLPDYQKAAQPNHVAAGFPTACESCHRATDTSWRGANFNHASAFPLVGVHATQACAACHKNNVFKGTARDCAGCHLPDYQKAAQPNHVAAGFPTACESCHRATDTSWRGASFNHASVFPLVGVHATQACAACHVNNVFKGTPRDCAGCHLSDYQKAAQPNHVAAGFPTTCDSCHRATDTAWKGAGFSHSTYPLVGVHATVACATCHKNNVYRGTPRDCASCHLADYQRSQNPNHAAAGFPTTCDSCHQASASTWSSSFNHNQFFPLLGRHASQPCSACHKNNVYAGTPRDCYPCHQTDYANSQNPNHVAAGFPTTCETCHKAGDSSWQQGTFNHTWFPITSGRHAGNPCSACHTSSSNYAVFTCTTCHTRSNTDSHHTGVSGYRYDSAACYACHPTGRGD